MMYKILLVDDEAMSKKSLVKILTSANSSYLIVGEASDGAEALRLAEKEQPHLIITDISMPVMDGLELIHQLRSSGSRVDIVILSGYGEFEYAQQALRYGVADYILKPMRQEQVTQVVEQRYERFVKSNHRVETKNRLIAPVSAAAERIGSELWIANEAGLGKEAESLRHLLEESELSDEERVSLLRDAASLIGSKLKPQHDTAAWSYPYDSKSFEEAAASFASWLEDTLKDILEKRNWGKRSVIQQAIDYIQEHFSDSELSLEKVLSPLGISPTHFYHMLMEETGMSYIAYLTHVRMEHAKELLEHSELKTYEVGQRCGYPDYPHFTKRFKRQIGLTPTEYRKNMQQK
ncbi:response regulator [Paenibacillus sp. NPDC058071]|uniref:response regulator n=1 Tax=Paenibacillus sp. NPDC058071 TaxID=3346326 RepID=UPI0036DF2290